MRVLRKDPQRKLSPPLGPQPTAGTLWHGTLLERQSAGLRLWFILWLHSDSVKVRSKLVFGGPRGRLHHCWGPLPWERTGQTGVGQIRCGDLTPQVSSGVIKIKQLILVLRSKLLDLISSKELSSVMAVSTLIL